jgi:hypothetical protein
MPHDLIIRNGTVGWDPFMTSSSWHGVTDDLRPRRAANRGYPMYANDFPNGKGRLPVKAEGYALTLVNGQVVTEHGAHTPERAPAG